jgi:hypothetical protein
MLKHIKFMTIVTVKPISGAKPQKKPFSSYKTDFMADCDKPSSTVIHWNLSPEEASA